MLVYSSFLTFSRKIALAFVLIGFTLYASGVGVRAQSEQQDKNDSQQLGRPPERVAGGSRLLFVPPPSLRQDIGDDLGRPPNRTSGGSRGPCTEELVALVPGTGKLDLTSGPCTGESVSLLALTSVESPTFWFYVPQPPTPGLTAEFVLLEGEKLVHKQTIPLTKTPGIVSFQPNYKLEPDKSYRWIFSIAVNAQRPSQNPSVEGLIQLVPTDIALKLNRQVQDIKLPRDEVVLYASNGVWHDALTALGQQRRNKPTDSNLKTDWSDLLDSVGLSAIADAQIVECCTPVSASRPSSH